MTQHTVVLVAWGLICGNVALSAFNIYNLIKVRQLHRRAAARLVAIDATMDQAIAANVETQANLAESRAILARLTPGWEAQNDHAKPD